jgi:glycosyltransferase involved in cell wall biosynthesis
LSTAARTDGTRDIAAAHGAEVLQNPWINYATQFNWAIDHAAATTDWIMRLDADEIVTPELAVTLAGLDAQAAAGLTVNRRIHFLGRWIRWGGIYPVRVLRVWRTGRGRCEDRWMDEHILVDGAVAHVDGDIADINLNSVTWWTQKHNGYATREAIDELLRETRVDSAATGDIGRQAGVKRWVKRNVYAHLPLGGRAFAYFIYRYFILLGFLDGWQGLAFHGLQGGWYRFLVDVKVYEIRELMRSRGASLAEVVAAEYGHRI